MTARRSARAARTLALAAALTVGTAQAQNTDDPCDAPRDAAVVDEGWTRHLAPEAEFVLDLPPTTSLHASESTWYVMLHDADGRPGLPGMSVTRLAGRSLQQAIDAFGFPPDARTTPVRYGPGTRGACVSATYETEMEGRYTAHTYLVEVDDATFVLQPWEGMGWDPFDAVARSFTTVRPARPFPPEPPPSDP